MTRAGLLAALAAVALLAGCASGESAPPGAAGVVRVNNETGWNGTPVRNGYPLPAQRFRDTSGTPVVPAADVDAPVTLVFFGYTHCPDICNVVLATIASALRGLPAESRRQVQVLFVATDPARDTAPVVRDYLDRFDPAFEGLVGPVEVVEAAARDLHISYERPDGTVGGAYEVEHGAYVTGFVDGRARVVWSETTSVRALRADLRRLVSNTT